MLDANGGQIDRLAVGLVIRGRRRQQVRSTGPFNNKHVSNASYHVTQLVCEDSIASGHRIRPEERVHRIQVKIKQLKKLHKIKNYFNKIYS